MKSLERLELPNFLSMLCSLYSVNKDDISISDSKLYDVLHLILNDTKKIDYPAMRRTIETILFFGVRISEVKNIVMMKNKSNVVISIICYKQKLVREYIVNIVDYNKYLYSFFEVEDRRTLLKKEAERRIYKYFPYLKNIRYIGIKSKTHFFRHLHITILRNILNMSLADINKVFMWSDLRVVEDYVLEDSALLSLPLNTK